LDGQNPDPAAAGRIIDSMLRLAQNDHAIEIPYLAAKNEIGQMARAVRTFQQAAVDKLRLEQESIAQQRLAKALRSESDAERKQIASKQQQVVAALAKGLEKLSSGDLTYRLDQTFPSEYEKLRTDFNYAIAELQHALQLIIANSDAIRAGIGEASFSIEQLARRAETQASSLEETAAALNEITATVHSSATSSAHARESVRAAETEAQRGNEISHRTITAMNEIQKSSQEISGIIDVINEIAVQTNLLALNAGVEAARAGHSGHGFAIIAAEVRTLAQRCAAAVKETQGLIGTSRTHVEKGVNLVNETSEALKQILAQAGDMSQSVAELSSSSHEQATSLHHVNASITDMDRIMQQNAALIEETATAHNVLVSETAALVDLIGQFKIAPDKAPRPLRPAA
jgi:methyl-accepting chemotaxis protein